MSARPRKAYRPRPLVDTVQVWRDAASGGEVGGEVVAWSEPAGPDVEVTGRL